MIQYDEYLRPLGNVERLGFSSTNPQYIPVSYLDENQFILWRTCHSFGDWVLISSIPRFLKLKYPKSIVFLPSPKCINKFYSPQNWLNKSSDPFNNVVQIFYNNPYIDGMIDDIPDGLKIYHDHFRIYDINNPDVLIAEQMLKFWRFNPKEIIDSSPELYWTDEEKREGDEIIKNIFINESFGFLYIDDSFFYTIPDTDPSIGDPLKMRRYKIQQKINEFNNLVWLYYAGKDITETCYKTKTKSVDVRTLKTTLRIQNYIKSRSKLIIGHQGGYGTDCMSRYTTCYVVPLTYKTINEHFIRTTKYLI